MEIKNSLIFLILQTLDSSIDVSGLETILNDN
jgi:hypothetical protein